LKLLFILISGLYIILPSLFLLNIPQQTEVRDICKQVH